MTVHQPRAAGSPSSRPTSSPDLAELAADALDLLRAVLGDLTYPAERWQILAAAHYYGADAHTIGQLHRLPTASYPSLRHIAHAYIHAAEPSAPSRAQR